MKGITQSWMAEFWCRFCTYSGLLTLPSTATRLATSLGLNIYCPRCSSMSPRSAIKAAVTPMTAPPNELVFFIVILVVVVANVVTATRLLFSSRRRKQLQDLSSAYMSQLHCTGIYYQFMYGTSNDGNDNSNSSSSNNNNSALRTQRSIYNLLQ